MNARKLCLAIAGLAFLALPQPASAGLITYVFSGSVVSNGTTDFPAGATYSGQATLDDTTVGVSNGSFGGGASGLLYQDTSASWTVTVGGETISGTRVDVDLWDNSGISANFDRWQLTLFSAITNPTSSGDFVNFFQILIDERSLLGDPAPTLLTSLALPGAVPSQSATTGAGGRIVVNGIGNDPVLSLDAVPTTPPGPGPGTDVPLPATLAIFGVGLAMVGFAGWRRRGAAIAN